LSQAHAALSKDLGRLCVYQVALVVHDLADTDLGNLDAAGQARASIAVQNGRLADAVAAGFEEGILFGVQTEAGGQIGAAFRSTVASRA
jgi:hypothetical protein